MKADAKTEAEVMAVVSRLIEAFKNKDVDGALVLYAPDPDVVTIGTGIGEKHIGLAERRTQLERYFSQVEDISIQLGWHSISAAGPVAWVAADIVAQGKVGEQEISTAMRTTMIFEQRMGRWLIVHGHSSLPSAW